MSAISVMPPQKIQQVVDLMDALNEVVTESDVTIREPFTFEVELGPDTIFTIGYDPLVGFGSLIEDDE